MSKKKPQWLIDAEKELKKFNDSKYGKLSDTQIARIEGAALSRSKLTKKTLSENGKKSIAKRKANKEQWDASVKNFLKAGGKAQGKIQGKKNVESGHIQALGRKSAEFNNREQTCPHCGKTSRGVGYERWHGDRCNTKKTKDESVLIFNHLTDWFTKPDFDRVVIKLGLTTKMWNLKKLGLITTNGARGANVRYKRTI